MAGGGVGGGLHLFVHADVLCRRRSFRARGFRVLVLTWAQPCLADRHILNKEGEENSPQR